MGETNRWKVTYTKHLKQKRKVYHDGFLDIHRSSNKTMLYDECEKLLECRLLKQDEVICSGETLVFNSYLVDIDAPKGDHKLESGLNFQAGDDKISEKSGVLRRKSFRNVCFGADKNKTQPTLSPSQKIIREFKKSRLKCYVSPQTCPDTRKTEETEWQVLYTTNITQKAKKYHDGFLKLSICGSHGRKLLDSRFIKKDETVKSGKSIDFDAHLVEIGECVGDHKPPIMSSNQGRISEDGGTRVLHGQKKCFNENEISTGKEWHVLFTSQMTQKSKKYHNGIIRISFSGSHHMQVTLLNEDKIILSSKHISLSKNLMTGEILELPKYLVEVDEACESVKAHEILSILQRPKATGSIFSGPSDENISVSVSSFKVPEPSLEEACDRFHKKPSENLDTKESTKNAENNRSIALIQSPFTGNARTLTEDVEIGCSSQLLQSDHVEAKISYLKNSISRAEGSSVTAACDLVNDEGKICEEITYEREIDACPSFDLEV